MKKNGSFRKVTTFLMSLVMVLTLFGSMKLEVRAADNTWVHVTPGTYVLNGAPDPSAYILRTGETLEMISTATSGTVQFILTYRTDGNTLCEETYALQCDGTSTITTKIGNDPRCSGYAKWKPSLSGNTCYLDAIIEAPASPSSSETPASPSTAGGQKDSRNSASKEPDTNIHTHSHSYSWVTVQEANADQDGIEEYRCSCGDVQERNTIPASEALVKGLFGEIKDAPLNGSTTFDTGRQYTLSDYLIKKLSERMDVTTVITFEYEGQSYRMTIPAGADYSQLLADEEYFYGYFYFAGAVGAVIEVV